jgi:hypothetical protein
VGKTKIIPITKSGKESSIEVSKFRPISLINVGGNVLEKILITRIMHHAYSNNLLNSKKECHRRRTSSKGIPRRGND